VDASVDVVEWRPVIIGGISAVAVSWVLKVFVLGIASGAWMRRLACLPRRSTGFVAGRPLRVGSTWEREKDRPKKTGGVRGIQGTLCGRAGRSYRGHPSAASRATAARLPHIAVGGPVARGAGVGDSLIAAVTAWAKDAGYQQLMLWVTEGNANARSFYQRHGFRRTAPIQPVRAGEDRSSSKCRCGSKSPRWCR